MALHRVADWEISGKTSDRADLRSAGLMKLDYVTVGIAHEDRLGTGLEADRAAAQREARRLQHFLRCQDVGAQQREVSDAGMLLGDIHQDVRLVRSRRIEHEVDLHS